jgi:hypothetical protein
MSEPKTDADLIENTIPVLAVKLKIACLVSGFRETKGRKLIDKGEWDSYMDDGVRMVTMASIHRRLARLLTENRSNTEKTAAAVEASLKLAQRRRLEKAKAMAAERRARQLTKS